MAVTAGDVLAAAERIAGRVKRTPVVEIRAGDRTLYLKCENLQDSGSFKLRGATNWVTSLDDAALARGVMAFSSGNHAAGVALAAQRAGAKARVVMPHDAPAVKVVNTRSFGAEIVSYNRHTEDREAICRQIAAETGATVIPPFDHELTIAGQGTAALELLEQAGELDALIAPIGGGGLLAGSCLAARLVAHGVRLFGAEPEIANDAYLSLRAGTITSIPVPDTIADGLRSTAPGQLTFPVLQSHLDDILLVSEDEIVAAMRWLAASVHLVAEPSGAVATAAAMSGKLPAGLKRVGIVISGGNVEPESLAAALR